MDPLLLRELTLVDEGEFLRAFAAFPDPHFTFALDYQPEAPFSSYLARLDKNRRGLELPSGWVPTSLLFGFVHSVIVGRLSIRHQLNPKLKTIGGHIGYGVVPEHRRCGYATEMLRQSLPWAGRLGIRAALLTCDDGNIASQKTIEACGGVLEGVFPIPQGAQFVLKRRYWIACLGNSK